MLVTFHSDLFRHRQFIHYLSLMQEYLLYVGQENDILKVSGPVFRNQFYSAWFQSANERRQLRPMRAKQAQALNKIDYTKRVQMFEKLNFLSFHTIVSLIFDQTTILAPFDSFCLLWLVVTSLIWSSSNQLGAAHWPFQARNLVRQKLSQLTWAEFNSGVSRIVRTYFSGYPWGPILN